MEKKRFLINMTEDEMLRFYKNQMVEQGILSCTNFDTTVNLKDFGYAILENYKDKILDLLYKDERIADVTIDKELNVDMVFYTDYCPYYYDVDDTLNNSNIVSRLAQSRILEEFSSYYAEKCLFNKPYITTRELINDFIESQNLDIEKKGFLSNFLKMNIIESGFVEKYIENTEVYVTPKNYKEFEKVLLKQCKEIENNNAQEDEEEIE